MALDLSALEGVNEPAKPAEKQPAAQPSGKPLELRLTDIDEDPDQPRKEFGEDAMAEMIASVKARGVKSPVSVRPNPDSPGRYILNHGARRYRASMANNLKTIPAFIDEQHDDYDQVIENMQREDLTAMELAHFIKRKQGEGESLTKIAKKLQKSNAAITKYTALIDAPEAIESAYREGRCTSPETLYSLRKVMDSHPDEANEWLAATDEITRANVAALADAIKKGTPILPSTIEAGDEKGSEAASGQGSGEPAITKLGPGEADEPKTPAAKMPDPTKIAKPLLIVEFDGRAAAVLLNNRPSSPGLLYVKYEDNGEVHEVDAGRCKINSLLEGKSG